MQPEGCEAHWLHDINSVFKEKLSRTVISGGYELMLGLDATSWLLEPNLNFQWNAYLLTTSEDELSTKEVCQLFQTEKRCG